MGNKLPTLRINHPRKMLEINGVRVKTVLSQETAFNYVSGIRCKPCIRNGPVFTPTPIIEYIQNTGNMALILPILLLLSSRIEF